MLKIGQYRVWKLKSLEGRSGLLVFENMLIKRLEWSVLNVEARLEGSLVVEEAGRLEGGWRVERRLRVADYVVVTRRR